MVMLQYAHGIFPWHEHSAKTLWWCPDPRCVLIPGEVHVSKSLAKTIRQKKYEVRADTAFEKTIRMCAGTRPGTWISERMIQVMVTLHKLGHAHSIETWEGDHLVGGLYGVAVGQMFFGESMFSIRPNASKVALARAGEVMAKMGIPVIDCQLGSPHLKSMGARFMPRPIFMRVTAKFVNGKRFIGPWTDYFTN
jgi:leucyl/phenylalanyl-tRNA--protein transferase